jgi:hypothetical protein
VQSAKSFEDKLHRIMKASGATSDASLAKILHIKPPSVAAARKRQQIPTGWVELIASNYGVCADWLFFGEGPMHREIGLQSEPQAAPPIKQAPTSTSDAEELRQENRELRADLRKERDRNEELVKKVLRLTDENAELRIKLARAAPDTAEPEEPHRRTA